MEEREYIIILYDYYGCLFTEVQKAYFEAYYFDNFSLGEISENEEKSRNAIHKIVKKVVRELYRYEKLLGLYEKDKKLKKIASKIENEDIKKELEGLL